MQDLAAKLMGKRSGNTSSTFAQVESQANSLLATQSTFRVGLWPIRSETEPETAMGIAVLLGYLLEQWTSIRVYRIFAQLEDEPENFEWDISDSQFGVDDWEIDGLDENVAIWGTLEYTNNIYDLTVEIENDLADEGEDSHTINCQGTSLADLVAKLPQVAKDVATYLDVGEASPILPDYQVAFWDEADLRNLLQAAFRWELNLLLDIGGKPWSDEQINSDFKNLLEINLKPDNSLGDWVAANSAARVLSPLYGLASDSLWAQLETTISDNTEWGAVFATILAVAVYKAGYKAQAYDFLETSGLDESQNVHSWLALAEIYWLDNEIGDALNTFQRAIEAEAISTTLFLRYADLLALLDAGNILLNIGAQRTSVTGRTFIEKLVLIEPERSKSTPLLDEAVASYRRALDLDANHIQALSGLLIQLIDIRAAIQWPDFAHLVSLDTEGDYTRGVIEVMYALEDLTPAIDILAEAVESQPNRVDLRLNLASLYLLDEQGELASEELSKARGMTQNKRFLAEIDHLTLSADDPDFDAHLGELTELIDAGNELSAEDIEFLEEAVDNAPLFPTPYILLASGYLKWGETSDALDVLLDGQKQLPDNGDIAALLAKVLWQSGETQLAFDCLNQSLAKNPNHVALLALTGRFLFEDGQEEEAKTYLSKAEGLEPRNPILREARVFIANQLNKD
jgi:tetratricopeptide (TPR) repeat protein